MAVVNPEIQPTNTPKYGNDSRAVDIADPIRRQGVQQNQIMPEGQKIGDRSAEYEGQAAAAGIQADAVGQKGWGDLFSNIVGIGDYLAKGGVQMVKKDIENRVYEVADKERQAYTAELEQIKTGVASKNLLDANASADEVPEAVSDLPDTLATLKSARDGGKITKTDYQGRLLEHAKTLRAQYPGFKQEIDQEFAKVTGQNPANARINSLITEINRQAGSAASEQNKMLTYIRSAVTAGVPRADELYVGYKNGIYSDTDVITHIGRYNQAKEKLAVKAAVMNDKNLDRTESQRVANEVADAGLGNVVAASADMLMGKLGLTSPEKVQQLQDQQNAGQLDTKKWAQLNQDTANHILQVRTQMIAEMNKTGVTKRLGGVEAANKKIDEQIKPLLAIQDRITNKDFGGIYAASKESTAILDDTKVNLLKDSKAGPIFASQAVMKELGGEQYLQQMNLRKALGKDGIPDAYSEWYNRWKMKINTQSGAATTPEAVVTYNTMFQEMKDKGINNPKINKDIVKEVEKIGDSKTPDGIAAAIALSAFSPGNRGFISKLNVDGVDAQGRPIGGQNAVFTRWTSPEVTNRIKQLSKSNPDIGYYYETWAKETFANELFNREINDLSKITKDPNIKISWDSENKRFEATRTSVPQLQADFREGRGGEGINSSETIANINQFKQVSASIARINGGLYNLKNIAQESMTGKDLDAYLLKSIADANPDALKNVQSIPLDMLNKIMLGRAYGNRK